MSISPALGETKDVQVSGGTIRYRDTGEGPPIVFIHGVLVNGDLWRRPAPHLDGFRLVVPDLPLGCHNVTMDPGADLTPPGLARLIAELLEKLDLHDVTLVGNDTGGALCQLTVVNHPERIGRLVLTNCDAYENFFPLVFRPLQWAGKSTAVVTAIAQPFRLRAMQRAVAKSLAHHRTDRDVMDALFAPLVNDAAVRRDLAKVLGSVDKRYTLDAAKRFSEFRKPVLLAWGEDDLFFKTKYAERLARDFPDARLELIPNARTFVAEDQPETVARLIREFATPN